MSEQSCYNCRFWKQHDTDTDGDDMESDEGECRRYPPVANPLFVIQSWFDKQDQCLNEDFATETPANMWFWALPVTVWLDWCGEWQEAKEA